MLKSFRSKKSGIFLWLLMIMLVIGLAGFGIRLGGGVGSQDVATVGDQGVPATEFARAMDQQLRSIGQKTGKSLSMEEARRYGIDRQVLAALVDNATLDGEAARLGLSTGDDRVRAQVMAIPAFQGADGTFDRIAYQDALQRIGVTAKDFETDLRRESTRALLLTGIGSATRPGDASARTILGYLGERRGFDWLRLDAALLTTPVPAPTDAELQAEHDANPGRYSRPETKVFSYASVTPEALAASIEIPDDELRAAYDADTTRFHTPERRIVERIGFGTVEEAAAAKARLDKGEVDFDGLAAERGLKSADTDQGEVTAESLAPEVRTAVFGLTGPGIAGPAVSPLGPGLYRVNAILPAKTVPFDAARAELARSRALEAAQQQIHDETAAVEDLIASGATLEEIASETPLELGRIELSAETAGDLADDPAFRKLAEDAVQGEETDLAELASGGLITLRLEEVKPATVIPLAEIRDRVAADWTAARTTEALKALGDGHAKEIAGGLSIADLAARIGRPVQVAAPVTRGAQVPGVPADLLAGLFAVQPGGAVVRADPAAPGAILAVLTGIEAYDPSAPANKPVLEQVLQQFRETTEADLVALYSAALRREAGVSVNERLIDTTLARFP